MNPIHFRVQELLKSGQVLRGVTTLAEDSRRAVYTVKLSYRKRCFYYELYKDGIPYQCMAQRDFSRLVEEITHSGILQLEELNLPY